MRLKLEGKKVGFAMCGSFCTFSRCFETLEQLAGLGCELIPIMSFNAYSIDTRFGEAKAHIKRLEEMCGREIIHTIEGAEPVGPKKMADIMLVANCTGNTLAKLALSITDTAVVVKRKHVLNKNTSRLHLSQARIILFSSKAALSFHLVLIHFFVCKLEKRLDVVIVLNHAVAHGKSQRNGYLLAE